MEMIGSVTVPQNISFFLAWEETFCFSIKTKQGDEGDRGCPPAPPLPFYEGAVSPVRGYHIFLRAPVA